VWSLAERLVSAVEGSPGDWNQALMELGAMVCTPKDPGCAGCPVAAHCLGRARGIAAQLPHPSSRSRPLDVRRVSLVVTSGSRVVLARRRTGVLFGGLWEPPAADGDDPAALASMLGVAPAALRPGPEVVHVLSHRRLHVRVFLAPMGRARRWTLPGADYEAIEAVPVEQVTSRPHATLARKVLAAAGVLPLAKGAHPGLPSKR
jgi:A/G-specific adenine glycosylase